MPSRNLEEMLAHLVKDMDQIWDRVQRLDNNRLYGFVTQYNTGTTIAEVRNFALVDMDEVARATAGSIQMAMALSTEIGMALKRDPYWKRFIAPMRANIYRVHSVNPHLASYIYSVPRFIEVGQPAKSGILRAQDSKDAWPFELTADDRRRLKTLRISAD